VVILADPRCLTRSYGSVFRAALPVPLARATSVEEAVRQAVEFLGAAVTVAPAEPAALAEAAGAEEAVAVTVVAEAMVSPGELP
jgi:hypothetical protein